jgi:hypothetical protein
MRVVMMIALACAGVTAVAGQDKPVTVDPLYRGYDEMLDLYVRDGFVYYNALRSDRGRLDRFVAALNGAAAAREAQGSRQEQQAFWVNAYNAFVLKTVVDHFPIRGRSSEYPAASIRQIPGAFEKPVHRAAGRAVSLDSIEKDILANLGDVRTLLALGRGAVGGGRLRSEAYDASRLDDQLSAVAAESVTRKELVRVDPLQNQLSVSPVFSWREPVFVDALANQAHELFRQRSPLERAVLALIEPHLVGAEAAFLEKNTFRMEFHPFDWRLNDLSTRHP